MMAAASSRHNGRVQLIASAVVTLRLGVCFSHALNGGTGSQAMNGDQNGQRDCSPVLPFIDEREVACRVMPLRV